MTAGKYSLVRCIPDPIRGELFNIGVIAWDDTRATVVIDEKAAQRAIGQSRLLASDAWVFFEESLREQLFEGEHFVGEEVDRIAEHPVSDVLRLTRPNFVQFGSTETEFDSRVQRILARMVKPRVLGASAKSPVDEMKSLLKPLIKSGRLHTDWHFDRTRSGKRRTADFFLNHGANIALDAIRTDYAKESDASRMVDAQAYKVEDVLRSGADVRYMVYLRQTTEINRENFNEESVGILRLAGATVVQSSDAAASALGESVAPHHRGLRLVGVDDDQPTPPRRISSGG